MNNNISVYLKIALFSIIFVVSISFLLLMYYNEPPVKTEPQEQEYFSSIKDNTVKSILEEEKKANDIRLLKKQIEVIQNKLFELKEYNNQLEKNIDNIKNTSKQNDRQLFSSISFIQNNLSNFKNSSDNISNNENIIKSLNRISSQVDENKKKLAITKTEIDSVKQYTQNRKSLISDNLRNNMSSANVNKLTSDIEKVSKDIYDVKKTVVSLKKNFVDIHENVRQNSNRLYHIQNDMDNFKNKVDDSILKVSNESFIQSKNNSTQIQKLNVQVDNIIKDFIIFDKKIESFHELNVLYKKYKNQNLTYKKIYGFVKQIEEKVPSIEKKSYNIEEIEKIENSVNRLDFIISSSNNKINDINDTIDIILNKIKVLKNKNSINKSKQVKLFNNKYFLDLKKTGNRIEKNRNTIYLKENNKIITTFKNIPDKWYIVANRYSELVTVFYEHEPIFQFNAVFGDKSNPTPLGRYFIINKIKNPNWFFRGKTIKNTSSKNELGYYWLGLGKKKHGREIRTSYGLHGTNKFKDYSFEYKNFIQKGSLGCINLKNEVITFLGELIPKNTIVDIIDDNKLTFLKDKKLFKVTYN